MITMVSFFGLSAAMVENLHQKRAVAFEGHDMAARLPNQAGTESASRYATPLRGQAARWRGNG
jgi:hypothetical protein